MGIKKKNLFLQKMFNLQYWWLITSSLGKDLFGDCFWLNPTCVHRSLVVALLQLWSHQVSPKFHRYIFILFCFWILALWHTSLADTFFLNTTELPMDLWYLHNVKVITTLWMLSCWLCSFFLYFSYSLFAIKCKKLNLMWKNSGNVLLGHLGVSVFNIFPTLN